MSRLGPDSAFPAIDFFGCAGDFAELSSEISETVSRVLASGQVLGGPEILLFEESIAEMCSRARAIAVGSGTDALFFALAGSGIGPGDDVLVPAVSFVASASAIVRAGARPVFVDIDEAMDIDLSLAARKLTHSTKAIMRVPLFGASNDPGPIEAFASRHDLNLIEDFAQGLGSSFRRRVAGSIGRAGATSFDPTKPIGAPGSGGMVVTDDADLADRIQRLRLHGKSGNQFIELGYNSQLPSLTAAVLSLKLKWHEEWTRRRKTIADIYVHGLADLPIELPLVHEQTFHIWHKFVILTERRDELAEALVAARIPYKIHYERPLCDEPVYSRFGENAEVPRARDYCRRTLSLPIHSHLSVEAAHYIVSTLRRFFYETT